MPPSNLTSRLAWLDGPAGLVHRQPSAATVRMNYKLFVYKTYPNENYYVRRRDNIQVILGDMLALFVQHLKGSPLRAASATAAPARGQR